MHLYDPANIQKLASIDFVSRIDGIPTVMGFTAEVLMCSSLGVWAQRVYGMAQRYKLREINFPLNIATYIGILARNTGVAETDLGHLYEQGKGVPLDYIAAYLCYGLGAEGGDPRAIPRIKALSQIMEPRQVREAKNQAVSKMLETGRPQVSSEESEKTSLFEPR